MPAPCNSLLLPDGSRTSCVAQRHQECARQQSGYDAPAGCFSGFWGGRRYLHCATTITRRLSPSSGPQGGPSERDWTGRFAQLLDKPVLPLEDSAEYCSHPGFPTGSFQIQLDAETCFFECRAVIEDRARAQGRAVSTQFGTGESQSAAWLEYSSQLPERSGEVWREQ